MFLCIIFFAYFGAISTIPIDDEEFSRVALQNPDLFEGDILGIEPGDRNVHPNKYKRWPLGKVPYVIDSSLSSKRALIELAMEEYHKHTCIQFVPRNTERYYIKIFSGEGCYSNVGMVRRPPQPVSLGPGCWSKGTIVHELGHAIGFYHEQNRSDREEYLKIYWDNIMKGNEDQFVLLKPSENLLLTPFDYDSIMIYGNYAFSKDPKDPKSITMEAKNGQKLLEPYSKKGLTQSDITRIKEMYFCFDD